MRYEVTIDLDDTTAKASLLRLRVTARLAEMLELGNVEGIEVTVRTSHPSMGPTIVHVRGGKVSRQLESLPPSSEG